MIAGLNYSITAKISSALTIRYFTSPSSISFPESWTESRIKVEVDIAYKNRTHSLLDPRKWEGTTPSGIKVEGYIAPNTTVYPLP